MPGTAIELLRTPDFEFSGFYFPEIAARIRRFNRANVPEITNEDLREIFIQAERAFALMAHYNNVLTDMVAVEQFFPTSRLPESVRLHLELIDFKMLPASPAEVDMLGELSRTYSAATRLYESNRRFETERTPDDPAITFENVDDPFDLTARTDQLTYAYGMEIVKTGVCNVSSLNPDVVERVSGSAWVLTDVGRTIQISGSVLSNDTDDIRITEIFDEDPSNPGEYLSARLSGASFVTESGLTFTMRAPTANGAATLVSGNPFTLFAAVPSNGDKFYFGHPDVLFNRFDLEISSAAAGIVSVWEFYDPSETSFQPDNVTVDPPGKSGYIRFDLSTLLGIDDATGALVKVQHVPTGASLKTFSSNESSTNVVDIPGYLGQANPSTSTGDYLVSADWRPIDIIEDTTLVGGETFMQDGRIVFTLPQSLDDNWQKYGLYDTTAGELREAYFIRWRVVDNGALAAGPVPDAWFINNGTQYILQSLTQGRTVEDDPLGSSSGEVDQEFTLTQSPYINRTVRVFVDEGGGDIEYTEVSTLLISYATDRHFVADVQTDGTCIIRFGDGNNGKIPPIGTSNVKAIYRVDAGEDGNIGAGRLTVNRDGIGVFRSITNPRSGRFWVEADWDSAESLERIKKQAPRTVRTLYRAVTSVDTEILSTAFINTEGVKPVARARAYEEAFGPKTIELVVVGTGGASLPKDNRDELEEYFNGGEDFLGVLVTNHELTVSNFTPRLLGFQVQVTANQVVTEEQVLQTLSSLISPVALEDDRASYVWNFGGEVPLSRIIAEIFNISPGNVFKVVINSPSDDIQLATNELPVLDTSTTSVAIVAPTD